MSDIYKGPAASKDDPDTRKLDIGGAVNKAKSAVSGGAEAVTDWAGQQSDALRGAVHEKPLAAMGISAGAAFAAGLVVGFLLAKAFD